jgi:hypothetical protein
MKNANLEALKQSIAQPDLATRLMPLLRFRGSLSSRRATTLWNFANAMMLSECDSLADGRLLSQGEVGHLCGLHVKFIDTMSLNQFFNRIRMSPDVHVISPGIAEYTAGLIRWSFDLQKVGAVSTSEDARRQRQNKDVLKILKSRVADPAQSFYPFISREPLKEHELLLAVHNAVPKHINRAIRGDLCQDLLVAVICGDLKIENIPNEIHKYVREANKLRPHEMGDLARMGGRIFGSSGHTGGDNVFSNHDYRPGWKELCNANVGEEQKSLEDQVDELRQHFGCQHS